MYGGFFFRSSYHLKRCFQLLLVQDTEVRRAKTTSADSYYGKLTARLFGFRK